MKYALALAVLALSSTAHADNFRCGKWIASTDLSVAELLARCGEPDQGTFMSTCARNAGRTDNLW